MNAQLQGIEVERVILAIDDFAVQHAAQRATASERLEQFREVTVQRFLVATLDQDLVAVAKHQSTKAIPFRFEDPCSPPVIRSTRLASIGKTGGFTGRCIPESNTHELSIYEVNWF